jgi:hypothetical protein
VNRARRRGRLDSKYVFTGKFPGQPNDDINPLEQTTVLVIQSVKVRDIELPAPATIALMSVKNLGPASTVFPAGSVIARGDATQRGGIAFSALTTPTEFTIAAGESRELTLSVGDVCAAGNPGAVNFRIDPANVVRETDDRNNAMLVQVSSFASGDLTPAEVRMSNHGEKSDSISSSLPAAEIVICRVGGTGPILLCPGVTLWRETASPVSSKYGLREVKNMSGKPIIHNPRSYSERQSYLESSIPGALQPGDLPPGTFTWSIMMNPDGKIREINSSNNAVTSQITVK